jgi:hypothetical protein
LIKEFIVTLSRDVGVKIIYYRFPDYNRNRLNQSVHLSHLFVLDTLGLDPGNSFDHEAPKGRRFCDAKRHSRNEVFSCPFGRLLRRAWQTRLFIYV